jgi:iron-sulfur cluster assembly protein
VNTVAATAVTPSTREERHGAVETATLDITSRAAKKMRDQLKSRGTPEAFIRFGIRGGGCTGFSYMFEFSDQKRDSDHVFEKDGVSVLVDPKSMTLVRGTTLDFETGIRGHGFKFENPNVSDACGCGESVSF